MDTQDHPDETVAATRSEDVAEQERAHGRRRRRPTGTPPPLPRSIGSTGRAWLAAGVLIVVLGSIWLRTAPSFIDRIDSAILERLAQLRTPWLTSLARWINTISSNWGLALVGLTTAALVIAFRRFRHLMVYLVALALVEVSAQLVTIVITRPRPYGVTALVGWEGYAAPSLPIAALTVVLLGIAYALVVPGTPRFRAKLAIAALVVGLGLARMYLGVDNPTDVLGGAILGVAIPVALFRAFTPNAVFPVSYGKRGKAAHLDVTGRRGEAIREAVLDQLGFEVLDVRPVGLEGSGGSTPLKLRVVDEDGVERSIFAKLYARSHVRADRWYKLGRTILYGDLEDETPFKTVRRFVEYEDYALRLLGEEGFPTPKAYGIAEITPEREYLIAMEFFDGAVEVGEAEVDDGVIDQALEIVRRMWDIGLAHRDIKPANLMVRDGELKLIDVFFVQVRPSPWRQAVDLANMMLVLALRSDADRVYERALRFFSPDELAEAFAAARGVASPTQLQHSLKSDGRDLLTRFRALAPQRAPIGIQRWSVKRIGLIFATVFVIVMTVGISIGMFFPHKNGVLPPECGTDHTMILFAQAVPWSSKVPCVGELPLGWNVTNAVVHDGYASFGLTIGPADGTPEVTVTLTPRCQEGEGLAVDLGGGCVTYHSKLPPGTTGEPTLSDGISFVQRSELVDFVESEDDQKLCGLGVPCP
jgi:membrane-associated phospholipid phosphatase/tRNA A-37 threonylcarbamoyl transferase component Bud32